MDGIARDGSVYKSYIDNTPMNGVGEPEDVAQLVRFLIGAESRWITGQVIAVDGGHHLRSGPNFAEIVALIHGPEAVPGANP
jgi:NAD(P)-dependent dehydrogenase (short-subunit alcohol dehydrogenase family)